ISKAIINEYLEKIDAIASKLLNFELCHRHRIWSSRRPHSHCSSTVAACLSSGCFASIPWPLLFHFCLLCPIALSPSSRFEFWPASEFEFRLLLFFSCFYFVI
ncbi:hypothetical protein HN51_008007, partial [Arachis hypogaea]